MGPEISLIIPLAVFEDAEDLTPQAIRNVIMEAARNKDIIASANHRIQVLESVIRSVGFQLESLLDDEGSEFLRAKRMREMISELKGFEAKGMNE